MGWESVVVLSIGGRVKEERRLNGIKGRGSEDALCGRESVIKSKKQNSAEENQRKTEEF